MDAKGKLAPMHLGLLFALVSWLGTVQADQGQYDAEFERGFAAVSEGRLDEGITAFERCLELEPEDIDSAYNLACAHTRKGSVEQGLAWFERAVDWGYRDAEYAEEDSDLAALRSEPRFVAALERLHVEREQRNRAKLAEEARIAFLPAIDWVGGHQSTVFLASFSPEGERILTGSADRTARVWDAQSGETLLILRGHADLVIGAAFSADGERVLTNGRRSFARLWDSRSGELLAFLGDAEDASHCAVFSPDGSLVASGSSTGSVQLWNAHTGECARSLPESRGRVTHVAFGPDGASLAVSERDGRVVVWDTSSWEQRFALDVGETPALVDFGSSGLLVLGTPDVRMIDAQTGREVARFDLPQVDVRSAEISPDGRSVFAATSAGPRLWDVSSSRSLVALEDEDYEWDFDQARFSPDGSRLAASNDSWSLVWDARTGAEVCRFESAGRVHELAFSPGGERILSAASNTAQVRNASTGAELLRLGGHAVDVSGVSFSPDGERLALVGKDGCSEWNLRTGTALDPIGSLLCVEPQEIDGAEYRGTRLSSPMSENYGWRVADSEGCLDLAGREYINPNGGARIIVLSRDQRIVATEHLQISGTTPRKITRFWNTTSGEQIGSLESSERFCRVMDFDVSSDLVALSCGAMQVGRTPAGEIDSVATTPTQILLWHASSSRELGLFDAHSKVIVDARFSPDGRRLATASLDRTAKLWDVGSQQEIVKLAGHEASVNAVAFDASGERMATASDDGTVRLWRVPAGSALATLEAGACRVQDVAFSPDGRRLAAACSDGVARLWDTTSHELLATFAPQSAEQWLCFAPSLHYSASAGAARRAQLIVGGASYPLELFASTLAKPEGVAEALSGRPRASATVHPPPTVELLHPAERSFLSSERTVRLQAVASDRTIGVERIEVVQDGVLLARQEGGERREPGGKSLRLELALTIPEDPGETTITVQAVNARGTRSLPRTVTFRYRAPERDLYLLALGVSDYGDDALDLAYPVRDVEDVAAHFAAQAGALFAEVHVERLVDAEVSSARIRRVREDFLRRAKPEDTIVVFAAGHGVRTESGEYYFLTHDATPADPYAGIDRATLESLVTWDKLYAARRVLLIDTCQAGTSFADGKRGDARGVAAYSQNEVDARLDDALGGLYIIAASSDEGFAREQEGNGLFTRALLDGLGGGADENRDGYVSIEELKVFASREVHEKSGGRQRPTVPTVLGGEDFRIGKVPVPAAAK